MKRMKKKLITAAGIFLMMLLLLPACSLKAANVVIVLDPGHGGGETGATRTFGGITYHEERLNQKIADYCKQELETYEGVKVYMTRTSLSQAQQNREKRVNIAKVKKANALVSIHNNATGANSQTSVTGAYCVVPSTSKYPDSKSATAKTARALGKAILASLKSQCGLKNNGFWIDDELGIILFGQKSNYTSGQASSLGISKSVLNRKVPSIIVEHCFVNNPNDCKNHLKTNAQLKKMGVADAAGIAKYFGLKKKGTSSTTQTTTQTTTTTVKKTGLVKAGTSLYLYDKNGNKVKGLVKYNGKYYLANSNGKLYTGWKTYKNNRYYFDKKTGAAKTKWQTIGKYKYYFSTNGVMKKKWATIGGKRYYFSKVNGKLLTKYWLKYNNSWYYLDKNGNPLQNCTKKIGSKTYQFNSRGVCLNK